MANESMAGRVVLVTGARTGIGFETALGLAERGARVLVHARRPEQAERTVERLREVGGNGLSLEPVWGDFGHLDEVVGLAEQVLERTGALHVLVNNAGGIFAPRQLTEDGFERTLQVDHLAPFLLTWRLLPRLLASAPARVVTVASTAHHQARLDLEDLQSERNYRTFQVYARAKLANILFTRELARRLEGSRVTANCLHPGVVWTRFGRDGDAGTAFDWLMRLARPLLLTPRKGARTSIYLASSPQVERTSGEYFARCRPARSSRAARDPALARALWTRTERMLAPWLGPPPPWPTGEVARRDASQ